MASRRLYKGVQPKATLPPWTPLRIGVGMFFKCVGARMSRQVGSNVLKLCALVVNNKLGQTRQGRWFQHNPTAGIASRIRRHPLPCGGYQAARNPCNPVSSVPCILCTLFSVSRFPISVSGIVATRDTEATNLPPTRRVPRIWGNPSITLKNHKISTKVMKIGSTDTQNHEKWTLAT